MTSSVVVFNRSGISRQFPNSFTTLLGGCVRIALKSITKTTGVNFLAFTNERGAYDNLSRSVHAPSIGSRREMNQNGEFRLKFAVEEGKFGRPRFILMLKE